MLLMSQSVFADNPTIATDRCDAQCPMDERHNFRWIWRDCLNT